MNRRKFLKYSPIATSGFLFSGAGRGRAESGVVYDLLIKGGHLIDPSNNISAMMDVAVRDGVIAAVEPNIPEHQAKLVADADGRYVSPGFIDIHVHSFVGHASNLSVDAGENGRVNGVTTVVDAGTSGAADFEAFRTVIGRSPIRMLAFVNISSTGMYIGEQDPGTFDVGAASDTVLANPDICVGIKSAHYLTAEPYDGIHTPWASVDAALKAARACGKPAMFDFCPRPEQGVWPARTYRELLLEKMIPGDIHTHCYAKISQYQFPILDDRGKVNPYILDARASGRFLDVGHGAGSFHWANAEPAVSQGYLANSISTDLHTGSINGPVFSLPHVMSKFLALGVPLEEVVRRATVNPADEILRPDLGRLNIGHTADICIFEKEYSPTRFYDVSGAALSGDYLIRNLVTIQGGAVKFDRDSMVRDSVTGAAAAVPKTFGAMGNYPNPFNPSTTVIFELEEPGMADLGIFNGLGQRIRTLVRGAMSPGCHELVWDGRDDAGRTATSGVYFARLRQGTKTAAHEMLLLR